MKKPKPVNFIFTKADIELMAGGEMSEGTFKLLKSHLEGGFAERVFDMVKEEVKDYFEGD